MSNPTVSVVMPVYNGENYLRLALESVLCQTFEDFEIILIDDGSEDSTPDITQSFGDDRVRYVRQENAGVAVAVNHGISLARGRYFAWLSHDDLWTPEKLSEQLQALQGAGPAVCYTDMKLIDGEGKLFEERELPLPERRELVRAILMGEPVSMAAYSLVCELRCFEQVGLYDVKKRYTQDADMLLRLARTFPFVRVPEKLTLVRDHGTRGTKRPEFVAEADAFFRAWLDALTPVELSASPSAFGRAMSRKEIADEYLSRATQPWTGLARNQYLKAIGESPLSLPVVLGSFLVHYFHLHRYMYRLGLRTYLRRRLGPVLKRTFAPVREESRKDDADQDCV